MAAYINLWRWTEQGIRNVKDTESRVRGIVEGAQKAGGKMTVYWTQGQYDLVSIVEGLDEDAAMALTLSIGKAGNAHGETLRAYGMEDMERILKRVT